MSLFYRNIIFKLLVAVGFFLFLGYAGKLADNPVFARPFTAQLISNAAKLFLAFAGSVIFISWIIEANKIKQASKNSFLGALWQTFLNAGEARARRRDAVYESIPETLKRQLPNGLFWLLWIIVVGGGILVYMVWYGQNHL